MTGAEAEAALKLGVEEMSILQRQVTVYNLFGSGAGKSVMETAR